MLNDREGDESSGLFGSSLGGSMRRGEEGIGGESWVGERVPKGV